MQTQWRIEKAGPAAGRLIWALQNRVIDGDHASPWQTLGRYSSRKKAVAVGMLLRERGEPIFWPGGAIRMGIARVQSC